MLTCAILMTASQSKAIPTSFLYAPADRVKCLLQFDGTRVAEGKVARFKGGQWSKSIYWVSPENLLEMPSPTYLHSVLACSRYADARVRSMVDVT